MNSNLALQRIIRQGLSHPVFDDPVSVVKYMAGIQAQDFEMARWALGIRMRDPKLEEINLALDQGLILRAHIFRPTWHLIPGEDYVLMNGFSAPYLRKGHAGRFNQLGLNEPLLTVQATWFSKSNQANLSLLEQSVSQYSRFLNKPVLLIQ